MASGHTDRVVAPSDRSDRVVDSSDRVGTVVAPPSNATTGICLRRKITIPRASLGGSSEGDEDAFDELADSEEERRPSGDEDLMPRRGGVGLSFPLNDEDPRLPEGAADVAASLDSSSISGLPPSDAEDGDEVTRPVAAKKKKRRPDPPGSTFCDEDSLQRLRERCEISDEIELVVPDRTQRADAPPPGYFTMYENFMDHCLLWFPVPGFLLRFLDGNGISLAQINPRGLRHIIGIYVLSRECNAEISTEQLTSLLEFRPKGRADEFRYLVAPAPGRVLIDGFPSKDDLFECSFFFVKISEKTIEADCIPLVRTSWGKRVRPASQTVSRGETTAIHSALASGDGDWVKSFTRQRIQRALSSRIFAGKVLGRGAPRVSAFQRAELARAASTSPAVSARAGSQVGALPSTAPKTPTASAQRSRASDLTPDEIARRREQQRKRALRSEGKAGGTPDGAPPKRQKVGSSSAFVSDPTSDGAAAARSLTPGSGERALALARATVAELSAQLDGMAFCFEEDSRSRDRELSETRRTNAELVDKVQALEDDVASAKKRSDELSGKLSKASSRHAKSKEEIASLRSQLLETESLRDAQIEEAVSRAKDEAARSFASRTRQVARSLTRLEGTAKDNMLDLAEIDASLELIERLRGSDGATLDAAKELLVERKIPIYDARDVFDELVSGVRQALEIPEDADVADGDEEVDE